MMLLIDLTPKTPAGRDNGVTAAAATTARSDY